MRIPPFYRRPAWQRFFAGAIVGGCISWMIFLFMFGTIQEKQTKIIEKQVNTIKNLEAEMDIWRNDYKELNRKNTELLIIQSVKVSISEESAKKYGIKEVQSIFEAEEEVRDDLNPLLVAKDLIEVSKNKDLIKKVIENKSIKINNRRYKLNIEEIIFFTTISIDLELVLD